MNFRLCSTVMVPIAEEKSVGVLRLYATTLARQNRAQQKDISRLRRILDGARQPEFPDLVDSLSRLRVKYFAAGRESVEKSAVARPVEHAKQELLLHGSRPVPETEAERHQSR